MKKTLPPGVNPIAVDKSIYLSIYKQLLYSRAERVK